MWRLTGFGTHRASWTKEEECIAQGQRGMGNYGGSEEFTELMMKYFSDSPRKYLSVGLRIR